MPSGARERLAILPRLAPAGDGGVRAAAPAKINVNLLVGPRRPDGYHAVDSIAAKVTLYDEVVLHPRTDGHIALRYEGADCGPDEDNLALRAARALAAAAPAPVEGADIHLIKSVGPGKGLGGGSSDAAAVLAAANDAWGLGLDRARLVELAATLGSDVPLFFGPPAVRLTDRGQNAQPAAVHPFFAVLHQPEIVLPTAAVYAAFDRQDDTAMAPQIDLGLLAACRPSQWRGRLVNQLGPPARGVCPQLAELWDTLQDAVDQPVSMTGSGSALFILCDDLPEARQVARRLPRDLPGRTDIVRLNDW